MQYKRVGPLKGPTLHLFFYGEVCLNADRAILLSRGPVLRNAFNTFNRIGGPIGGRLKFGQCMLYLFGAALAF